MARYVSGFDRLARRRFCASFVAWPLATAAAAPPDAVREAAAEYRVLRRQRGHFEGAAWQPELDAWNGRKHRAMRLLGEHLAAARASPAATRALMGEPDAREAAGAAGREVWLYHWRGARDLLALSFERGLCVEAAWRLAHE